MPKPYKTHIPEKRLKEIKRMIQKIKPKTEQEKKELAILQAVFVEGVNPAELARQERFYSNRGKPMSIRRIQQIITQYVPDYYECRRKPVKNAEYARIRAEQAEIRKQLYLQNGGKCAVCGADNAELHHMIPLAFGGDNDPTNMIFLCKPCHDRVSAYGNRVLRQRKTSEAAKKECPETA